MKLSAPILLFALAGVAQADELTVKPGMWETTMTTTNSMMPRPITNTSNNCVTESTYRPKELLDGIEHCTDMKSDLSGTTLTFSMTCKMQGAEAKVSGRYTAADESGEGDMTIGMKMGPGTMNMEMKWSSQRVGDC